MLQTGRGGTALHMVCSAGMSLAESSCHKLYTTRTACVLVNGTQCDRLVIQMESPFMCLSCRNASDGKCCHKLYTTKTACLLNTECHRLVIEMESPSLRRLLQESL
eukprot:GHVL01014665.1.p2 GENE.GHVL01014665.1~~GHVL01014665.1.p2  ORF type:complete len:106 (-),score=2.79 GHVL01014665.1:297-614(-)